MAIIEFKYGRRAANVSWEVREQSGERAFPLAFLPSIRNTRERGRATMVAILGGRGRLGGNNNKNKKRKH